MIRYPNKNGVESKLLLTFIAENVSGNRVVATLSTLTSKVNLVVFDLSIAFVAVIRIEFHLMLIVFTNLNIKLPLGGEYYQT